MEETNPQESLSDVPSRRVSKARERQRRRRARKSQSTAVPSALRRAGRQLTPQDAITLPDIRKIPYIRQIGLAVLAGVFMVALILLVGLFKDDTGEAPPNAIWLGDDWTLAERTESDVADLVERLREHEIGTVYAWLSWLQPDGMWSGRPERDENFNDYEQQVIAFAETFNRLYPEARLYGWLYINLPTDVIADDEVVGSISAFSLRVTDRLNFDGVFLDVQPVWNDDENYLALLQGVRSMVGQNTPIAASIPPDWTPEGVDIPQPAVIAPGTVWDTAYKQRVALMVDQLVVQPYNSYLTSATDYPAWVAHQVEVYAEAVAELRTTTQVVIGLPIFEANPPAHDPTVETLGGALVGINMGLEQAGDSADVITGVGIFVERDMTADDWQTYRTGWLD